MAKTVESMRLRFPGRRVWAIFEPRSNTSRRNIFQEQYVDALSKADRVIIASPYREEDITPNQRFDADLVAGKLMRRGTDAHHIDCVEHIVEFVIRGIDAGDVILIMSNGAFDEINAKIIKALDKHRIFTDPASIPSGKVPK